MKLTNNKKVFFSSFYSFVLNTVYQLRPSPYHNVSFLPRIERLPWYFPIFCYVFLYFSAAYFPQEGLWPWLGVMKPSSDETRWQIAECSWICSWKILELSWKCSGNFPDMSQKYLGNVQENWPGGPGAPRNEKLELLRESLREFLKELLVIGSFFLKPRSLIQSSQEEISLLIWIRNNNENGPGGSGAPRRRFPYCF